MRLLFNTCKEVRECRNQETVVNSANFRLGIRMKLRQAKKRYILRICKAVSRMLLGIASKYVANGTNPVEG
jgi:hypothetical protein